MKQEAGPIEAVDTRSVADRVYDQLRKSLLQGKLRPGEPMTIRSMAKSLGTSEMPVRESLKRLLAERMIIQRPNRTYQVPTFESSEFSEITSVRVSLEGTATRRALEKAGDDLADRLKAHNAQMKSDLKAGDNAGVLTANQRFHFALYEASGSEILLQLIGLLWMRSGPYLAEAFAETPGFEKIFLQSTEIHDKIIEAVVARDEDQVIEALTEDLEAAARWYENHFTSEVEHEAP